MSDPYDPRVEAMRKKLREKIAIEHGLMPASATMTPPEMEDAPPPPPTLADPDALRPAESLAPQMPRAPDMGLAADESNRKSQLLAGVGRAGSRFASAIAGTKADTAYWDQMSQTAEGRSQLVHKSLKEKALKEMEARGDLEKLGLQQKGARELAGINNDATLGLEKYKQGQENTRAGLKLAADTAAEAAKKAAEVPKTAEGLRKELQGNQVTKDAQIAAASYNTMLSAGSAGKPTAAGDMMLIFSVMKIFDPTSGVKEGEYANAKNAGSVPERFVAMYNSAKNGTILTDAQRKDFLEQGKNAFGARVERYNALAEQYGGYADRVGVPRSDVVFDLGFGGGQSQAQQPQPSQPAAVRAKDGKVYRLQPDGTYAE